jgi:SAM-dependent methyltransferase
VKTVFSEIYARNVWGHGSGEGSLVEHTKGYRRFLEHFMRRRGVRSVVDYGCGDWQFSRLINWNGIRYLGLDVVDSLIDHHTKTYRTENIRFSPLNDELAELPEADLIIVKDVLQHWSYRSIVSFLPKIAKYRFALITNCVNPFGPTQFFDIPDGAYRPLDLTLQPFSLPMARVYEFTNRRRLLALNEKPRWKKCVLLQERMSS